jgi:transposase
MLRTGAPWQDLPDRYPSPATCHRRFQEWQREGVLEKMPTSLADDLRDRGKMDLSECFIDGTFVAAKKWGGQQVGWVDRGCEASCKEASLWEGEIFRRWEDETLPETQRFYNAGESVRFRGSEIKFPWTRSQPLNPNLRLIICKSKISNF